MCRVACTFLVPVRCTDDHVVVIPSVNKACSVVVVFSREVCEFGDLQQYTSLSLMNNSNEI